MLIVIDCQAKERDVMKEKRKHIKVLVSVIAAVLVIIAIIATYYIIGKPSRMLNKQLDLGDRYFLELDYENAVIAYTKALNIDSMDQNVREKLEKAYTEWAKTLRVGGDYESALKQISDAKGVLGNLASLDNEEISTLIEWAEFT